MQGHHAFLVYADSLEESAVPDNLKSPAINIQHILVDRFGINDARELSASARLRPLGDSSQSFVVVASELAVEAQNALLKLFEEPPRDVLFYLVLKKNVQLLPTLRSRLQEIIAADRSALVHEEFEKFLKDSFAERLESVAFQTKQKNSEWIEHILLGCEIFADEDPIVRRAILASVLLVRSYQRASGASPKMLLEELALLLPAA